MSKLVKLIAMMLLIGGAIAATPGSAEARYRGGGYFGNFGHFGGTHFSGRHFSVPHFGGFPFGGHYYRRSYYGGGWGGFGAGPAILLGLGAPYYYADWPYRYPASNCGWVRVARWGHPYKVWRCW